MLKYLKILFFKSPSIQEMLAKDAIIVDVRTPSEFSNSHIDGSLNIPLSEIKSKSAEIKSWNKPVIVCCASGARSGVARMQLAMQDVNVINGGPWQNVKRYLDEKN